MNGITHATSSLSAKSSMKSVARPSYRHCRAYRTSKPRLTAAPVRSSGIKKRCSGVTSKTNDGKEKKKTANAGC